MGPLDVITQDQLANDKLDLPDSVEPPRACMPAETESNAGVSLILSSSRSGP